MDVPIKLKIERSILNNQKKGFTARDIYNESEADMSYVLKVLRAQVKEGALIEVKTEANGRKHYKAKPTLRLKSPPAEEAAVPLWIALLKERIEQLGKGGAAAVAAELNVSPSTISGVVNGNYCASTELIEQKVIEKYADGQVNCPVLGPVKRAACMGNLSAANKLGVVGSKPQRKLMAACLQCKGLVHNCG